MPKPKITDHEILEAALLGLQKTLADVDEKIADLRRRVGGRGRGRRKKTAARPAVARKARRPLSAAARRRIAVAQKKRWAQFRKTQPK